MSITKKWEEYLSLNLNEDQERADQLFHEIIVETSRQLYENMMEEGDEVGTLMKEIEGEEEDNGMTEAEDDMDMDMGMGDAEADMDDADMDMDDAEADMDDAEMDMDDADMDMDDADMDMGDEEDMGGEGEPATKDDIMNLEDKLDELMAEFEAMMNDQGAEEEEEGEEEEEEGEEEEEESGVMESVQLKKVGGETYNKFGKMGDDGVQNKSPVAANSGAKGMASKPVKFSGDTESVPSSPKAPSSAAYHTKSEQNLPHAGKFMNVPDAAKSVAKGRGESAPKPKHETVKARSVVPESRVAKKRKV